jgi:hypothetical protein
MRGKYKIAVVTVALAAMFSCGRFRPFPEDGVIARVGDNVLTVTNVESMFSPGMAPADSLVMLESYANMWVRQQVKVSEAELMFSQSSADIDSLVQNYRNSLLTQKIDQYYIDNNIDTVITESDIAGYYDEHRADFVLDRSIVKGRTLKLPASYRQKAQMKQLMPGEGAKYQDFHDLALKNGFTLREYSSWTDLTEFLAGLPAKKIANPDSLLGVKGVIEIADGPDLYYAYIPESRRAGDVAPLERVRQSIGQVIYHQRRLDILKNYEDSIYRAAIDRGDVEVKINQ